MITLMKMIAGTGVSVITQLVTRSNGISIPLSSRTTIVPARGGVIETGPREFREFDEDSFFFFFSLCIFVYFSSFFFFFFLSSRCEWVTAKARSGKRMYVGHRVAQLLGNLTCEKTNVCGIEDEVNEKTRSHRQCEIDSKIKRRRTFRSLSFSQAE